MSNPVIDEIRARLHRRDQNAIIVVAGATGSGKSESSIRLAQLIDDSFNVGRIVWSVEAFLDIVRNGNLPKGSVIIWEEAGVGADSRTSMGLMNRAVTYLLETFRHLNLGLIITVPDLSMLDGRIHNLSHYYLETAGINYTEKTCRCWIYEIKRSSRYRKTYLPHPRINVGGEVICIESMDISKPDDVIVKEYKQRKEQFSRDLHDDLTIKIADSKLDKTTRTVNVAHMVDEVMKDPTPYLSTRRKKKVVIAHRLMAGFNIGELTAKKLKGAVEMRLQAEKSKPQQKTEEG